MKKKQTINQLVQLLEDQIHTVDHVDDSLEDTLDIYKNAIQTSKELIQLLNKNKKTYQVLKNKADTLLESNP